ncbi:MAG: hypothetical protein WBD86_02155 [Microgenomates group bacterium]
MEDKSELSPKPKDAFERKEKIEPGQDGWLTPEGNFYPCEPDEHDDSAKFLLSDQSPEDIDEREWLLEHFPPREIVKRRGYVLVRGKILPSNDFIKLTPSQLDRLNEAGVQILDSINNNEFSPKIAIKSIKLLSDRVDKIKDLKGYKEKVKDVREGLEERGENSDIELRPGLKQELSRKFATMAFSLAFGLTAVESIERFKESPLSKNILVDGHIMQEEEFVNNIFGVLTENYKEGVSINTRRWRFRLRVLETDDDNIYLLVEKEAYHHDGLTGGMTGDENYTVSAGLANKEQILERAKKIAKEYNRDNVEKDVVLEGENEIFSKEKILGETE